MQVEASSSTVQGTQSQSESKARELAARVLDRVLYGSKNHAAKNPGLATQQAIVHALHGLLDSAPRDTRTCDDLFSYARDMLNGTANAKTDNDDIEDIEEQNIEAYNDLGDDAGFNNVDDLNDTSNGNMDR